MNTISNHYLNRGFRCPNCGSSYFGTTVYHDAMGKNPESPWHGKGYVQGQQIGYCRAHHYGNTPCRYEWVRSPAETGVQFVLTMPYDPTNGEHNLMLQGEPVELFVVLAEAPCDGDPLLLKAKKGSSFSLYAPTDLQQRENWWYTVQSGDFVVKRVLNRNDSDPFGRRSGQISYLYREQAEFLFSVPQLEF